MGGTVAAAEESIKGAVYLYAAGKQNPIPLSGYAVKLYDPEEKKWSNPSITDAYGRYAFNGVPSKKFVLTVGKTGAYWHQSVWQQEVKAPASVRPIVLPVAADIVPRASFTERKEEKDSYDFSLWLGVPEEQKAGIRRVVYIFNNPTFKQKEYESQQASDGFRIGYRGWGCLDRVIIRIELQSANSHIDFNMCEALKAQK
jgi:hypothetical protein